MAHQFWGRRVPDRAGVFQIGLAEAHGAGPHEPTRIEIEISLPVFVRPTRIERAFEIEIKHVVETAPGVGVAWPVQGGFRPGCAAPHGGRWAGEVKWDLREG